MTPRATFLILLALGSPAVAQPSVRQATGFTITDVTDSTATISARLTASSTDTTPAPGRIRLRYLSLPALRDGQPPVETAWFEVDPATGSAHLFPLAGLTPATPYWLNVETTGPSGTPFHGPLRGRFTTAPAPDTPSRALFTVASGYDPKAAESPRGFETDVAINNMEPAFHCIAEPTSPTSFPRRVELSRYVPTYTPAAPLRSVRWGRDLEVWLLHTPGQTDALKDALDSSNAAFKLVVSPSPVIGSGAGLPPDVVALSGGTRWQGHLVDPVTGLREFVTGPASDALSAPPADAAPDRFQRQGGGFASALVEHSPEGSPTLLLRLHRPDGEVVHEHLIPSPADKPDPSPSN